MDAGSSRRWIGLPGEPSSEMLVREPTTNNSAPMAPTTSAGAAPPVSGDTDADVGTQRASARVDLRRTRRAQQDSA
jgi:hypothetical protein